MLMCRSTVFRHKFGAIHQSFTPNKGRELYSEILVLNMPYGHSTISHSPPYGRYWYTKNCQNYSEWFVLLLLQPIKSAKSFFNSSWYHNQGKSPKYEARIEATPPRKNPNVCNKFPWTTVHYMILRSRIIAFLLFLFLFLLHVPHIIALASFLEFSLHYTPFLVLHISSRRTNLRTSSVLIFYPINYSYSTCTLFSAG